MWPILDLLPIRNKPPNKLYFEQKKMFEFLYYSNYYYICSMNKLLKEIGATPITTSIIESFYPELRSPSKKVALLEKQDYIMRLKRGLYVVNPEYSGKTLSTELIANHLYTPSYISMSTALRYYGLIPEAVYVNQSMTIKAITTTSISRERLFRSVLEVCTRVIMHS